MNTKQRFKLGAGAGLVTMLLGALMVLAPGAVGAAANEQAGNPDCDALLGALGYTNIEEAKFEQGDDTVAPFPSDDVNEYQLVSGDFDVKFRLDADGVRFKEATSDVYLVSVKKGSQNQDMSVVEEFPAGVTEGFVAYTEGSFSNIKFCSGTPPQYGSFTIDKELDGNLAPADDPTFQFTIECTGLDLNDGEGTAALIDIKASEEPWSSDALGVQIPVNTDCLIEETGTQNAVSVGYEIDGGAATPNEAGQITVTVGSAVTAVLVTNDYGDRQPGFGDLVVSKVAGRNAPSPSPAFGFTVDCAINDDPIDLSDGEGTQAVFNLTFGGTKTFPNLPEGAICDVEETGVGGASSTTHRIDGGAVVNGTEATDLPIVAEADKAVAFTNNFPGGGTRPTYSVTIEKLAESDDANDDFSDLESAVNDGSDVEFELTINNTGTGALVVESLVDVYEGADGEDVEIDLLAPGVLECERGGGSVALDDGLLGLSKTVCTFTISDYARAGDSITNVVTLETNLAGVVEDDATVTTPEVAGVTTGTITVVKEVNEDAPAEWGFDFEGSLGVFELTGDASSTAPAPVDVGDYTIGEDLSELPAGWEFDEASCVDQSGTVLGEADADGSVDFTVAPDADVTCTFVNEYTAVAPAVVTPTTQPEKVLGVQTVRTLPRTGEETRGLAGVGAFMLALGAAMVIGSRRQLARR